MKPRSSTSFKPTSFMFLCSAACPVLWDCASAPPPAAVRPNAKAAHDDKPVCQLLLVKQTMLFMCLLLWNAIAGCGLSGRSARRMAGAVTPAPSHRMLPRVFDGFCIDATTTPESQPQHESSISRIALRGLAQDCCEEPPTGSTNR